MNQNEEKLRRSFQEALALSGEVNFEALAYRGIAQWDSVAHMQLVATLESTFDIMFETADVIGLSSFPVARTLLKKYGVELAP
jgi:acyl carrier protein